MHSKPSSQIAIRLLLVGIFISIAVSLLRLIESGLTHVEEAGNGIEPDSFIARMGQLGDSFGTLNVLVGSLTAFGVLITLYLQRRQMEKQNEPFNTQLLAASDLATSQKEHERSDFYFEKLERALIGLHTYAQVVVGSCVHTPGEVTPEWADQYLSERVRAMAEPNIILRLYFPNLHNDFKAIHSFDEQLSNNVRSVMLATAELNKEEAVNGRGPRSYCLNLRVASAWDEARGSVRQVGEACQSLLNQGLLEPRVQVRKQAILSLVTEAKKERDSQ